MKSKNYKSKKIKYYYYWSPTTLPMTSPMPRKQRKQTKQKEITLHHQMHPQMLQQLALSQPALQPSSKVPYSP